MNDITKRDFIKKFIVWFLLLALFLILIIIFLGLKDYKSLIPWVILSFIIIVVICFSFGEYLKYKHNTNVLEGTISNIVISYKSYQVVIKSDNQNYVASYDATFPHIFSSHLKDKVGRKCYFVVNKKGKAYIRDIE
ncbi:MAG: hypothetical protein K2I88_05305 [Anaeroplasmataceae bacterium]|nr:hypothetical protein [Anaeroplasmataceae bacterium]